MIKCFPMFPPVHIFNDVMPIYGFAIDKIEGTVTRVSFYCYKHLLNIKKNMCGRTLDLYYASNKIIVFNFKISC